MLPSSLQKQILETEKENAIEDAVFEKDKQKREEASAAFKAGFYSDTKLI